LHLIMFDIDGTLVNSSEFDEACYLAAAQIVLGVEISSNWEDYTFATDAGILDEAIYRYSFPGNRKNIHKKFKQVFTKLISEYVASNPDDVQEVEGASQFLQHLFTLDNVRVAIATGGWEETAKLKLKAANIDFGRCAFASSSDHYKRTEIMNIAESRASGVIPFKSKTYFGDASWDKKASKMLNYRFVLVGNRIEHEIQIDDYKTKENVLDILGL
jgi:phosphoglycolate phosphatase-like HAD superfamily hydrolase